jgi:voltage-gated potassium channel
MRRPTGRDRLAGWIARRPRVPPLLRPFLLVLALGTVGYHLIEGAPYWDAFYMTVISVTTVGFREVFPLSTAGEALTIVLIVVGIGTVAYGVGEYYTTFRTNLTRRRLMRSVEHLNGHYVVVGFGRVGENVAVTLRDAGREVLIVDRSEERLEHARTLGFLAIEGDATQDEVMRALGVERAAGFVVSTGGDAENLFIVLSARTLNPAMVIVARASDSGNAAKFRRAGANRVVSPYEAGGRYIANSLVRPNLTEFMEKVTLAGVELWLEEIAVAEVSPLVGQTIGASDLPSRTGATLVAMSRERGTLMAAPAPTTSLATGDVLIVLGTKDQLAAVERLAHRGR